MGGVGSGRAPAGQLTQASITGGDISATPGYGSSLMRDPVTGMLESRYELDKFKIATKLEFLRLAEDMYPQYALVCEQLGIRVKVFQMHLTVDDEFRARLDVIRLKKAQRVHGNMFKFSENPKNFMDRAMILRAEMPDLFNPDIKVRVTKDETMNPLDAQHRRIALENVIDAEIVLSTREVLNGNVITAVVPGDISPSVSPAEAESLERGDSTSQVPSQNFDPLSCLEE